MSSNTPNRITKGPRDDVEKSRNAAMKAIDDAKGRIVEAELKRYDAGQLAARLVADVPPDSAGAVIDQLKQLGKVARLEVHWQETNSDGTAVVTGVASLRTDRKPTRLLISIYNLANVAPRETTKLQEEVPDVDKAAADAEAVAATLGGRVIDANVNKDGGIGTATVTLDLPLAHAQEAVRQIRAMGIFQAMSAMRLMIGVLCAFAIAYRYYSAFLAAKVATLDDLRVTPAVRLDDGSNYHPTSK